MSRTDPVPLTVYFDGACPVCSREIALYRRQPGASALSWVDATACDPSQLGAGLTRGRALARFHVRKSDGDLASGAQAFLTLWQHLPRLAFLGRVLGRRPLVGMLELGYGALLFARRAWRRSTP